MQKLGPYTMPGLLLFHLVLLCVTIFTAREVHEFPPGAATVWAVVFSSLFLTALWAGLGSEPWTLRIPGCGALAALCWVCFRVLLEQMMPKQEAELVVLPLVAWVVLVGLLLCLRVIPFLKWRIVLMSTLSGATDSRPAYSLTRGVLIVVATWGGVFLLSKDSHHWFGLASALERWVLPAAITAAVLVPVTMICVGLTLTRLADWIFYRRRWTLPLLVAVVVGAAGNVVASGRVGDSFPFFLALILVTAALLLMGMSGYRLAPRSKPPEGAPGDFSGRSSNSAEGSPVGGLPADLRGAHVAALAALLVLFCALVPTGVLGEHKMRMISDGGYDTNDVGEITRLNLEDTPITNTQLAHLAGLANLEYLGLSRTRITDAGLVHLEGLANLTKLTLGNTPITDAGLGHLKGLTNLQTLSLYGTRITDAGLVHLEGLTNLQKLYLDGTQITDAGLEHLEGLTRLERLYLYLNRTQITDAGVAELKKALPNCEIRH
ncbi:MAG: hypothetical protein CMJ81_09755 [Planctomycetaceae bacterium]|nr:hypothetical protein [Planctomycetaceae bacterium]